MRKQCGRSTVDFEYAKMNFEALARKHFEVLKTYPEDALGVKEFALLQQLKEDKEKYVREGAERAKEEAEEKIEEMEKSLKDDVLHNDEYILRLTAKKQRLSAERKALMKERAALEKGKGEEDGEHAIQKRIKEIKAEELRLKKTTDDVVKRLKASTNEKVNQRNMDLYMSYLAHTMVATIEKELRNHPVLAMLRRPTPLPVKGRPILPSEAHKLWTDEIVNDLIYFNRRLAEASENDGYSNRAMFWLQQSE